MQWTNPINARREQPIPPLDRNKRSYNRVAKVKWPSRAHDSAAKSSGNEELFIMVICEPPAATDVDNTLAERAVPEACRKNEKDILRGARENVVVKRRRASECGAEF